MINKFFISYWFDGIWHHKHNAIDSSVVRRVCVRCAVMAWWRVRCAHCASIAAPAPPPPPITNRTHEANLTLRSFSRVYHISFDVQYSRRQSGLPRSHVLPKRTRTLNGPHNTKLYIIDFFFGFQFNFSPFLHRPSAWLHSRVRSIFNIGWH